MAGQGIGVSGDDIRRVKLHEASIQDARPEGGLSRDCVPGYDESSLWDGIEMDGIEMDGTMGRGSSWL